MGFSMIGYFENQDTAGTLEEVLALVDQHITTDGNSVLVPDFAPNLVGILAIGAGLTQAQVTSPSLRKSLQFDVIPLTRAAEPLSPPSLDMFFDNPIPLKPAEGLRALVAEDTGGAEDGQVFIWLMGEADPVPDGNILTVEATGVTTVTADEWSTVPLTISQQLEAGRWAIVGARFEGATCLAGRFIIPGSEFRPGTQGVDLVSDLDVLGSRKGGWGSWGEFEHTFLPQAEFFCAAADTAQTVWFDLVKLPG